MNKASQAVQASLHREWEKAITLNLEILEENPNDIDTLNRLAFAYTSFGKAKDARATYQKVLDIDPANPLALKNIKRVSDLSKNNGATFQITNEMFLEEVGKTKIITLVNVAPTKILRSLQIGQPLVLCIRRSKVFVQDDKKEFLGMLPDNISHRLMKFMEGGNTYAVYTKGIEDHALHVFVKEIKRASKYKNQPSFITTTEKQAFTFSKKKVYDVEDDHEE